MRSLRKCCAARSASPIRAADGPAADAFGPEQSSLEKPVGVLNIARKARKSKRKDVVMLKITFEGQDKIVETLRTKGPRVIEVLMAKTNQLMLQLRSYIVASKLSGQFLKRQTGALAGSVRWIPAVLEGKKIEGAVEAAGATSFYGKFYELPSAGGTGGTAAFEIMAVKKRALAFQMDGKRVFAKSVMHPAMAPRPFLSSSLDEKSAEIEAALRAAVDGVVNE
jgi:hypothetical protein